MEPGEDPNDADTDRLQAAIIQATYGIDSGDVSSFSKNNEKDTYIIRTLQVIADAVKKSTATNPEAVPLLLPLCYTSDPVELLHINTLHLNQQKPSFWETQMALHRQKIVGQQNLTAYNQQITVTATANCAAAKLLEIKRVIQTALTNIKNVTEQREQTKIYNQFLQSAAYNTATNAGKLLLAYIFYRDYLKGQLDPSQHNFYENVFIPQFILGNQKYILLLGGPGSGKTFLMQLCLLDLDIRCLQNNSPCNYFVATPNNSAATHYLSALTLFRLFATGIKLTQDLPVLSPDQFTTMQDYFHHLSVGIADEVSMIIYIYIYIYIIYIYIYN